MVKKLEKYSWSIRVDYPLNYLDFMFERQGTSWKFKADWDMVDHQPVTMEIWDDQILDNFKPPSLATFDGEERSSGAYHNGQHSDGHHWSYSLVEMQANDEQVEGCRLTLVYEPS